MPTIPNVVNEDGEETDIFSILVLDQEEIMSEKGLVRKKVRELIQNLPDDQKEVLIMRSYYDMSFKEIAESTGVSINTALGRMRYALINLRKMLDERQVDLPV